MKRLFRISAAVSAVCAAVNVPGVLHGKGPSMVALGWCAALAVFNAAMAVTE